MTPTVTISPAAMASFQRDLKKLSEMTTRPIPVFLNTKAYAIAKESLDATGQAWRPQIEELGLRTTGITERVNSKGKTIRRRKFVFDAGPAVTNYIKSLVHKKGKKEAAAFLRTFGSRAEIEKRARKWIAQKLRAIGFLASIWRPILAGLAGQAGQRGRVPKDVFAGKHINVNRILTPARAARLEVNFGVTAGADKSGKEFSSRQVRMATEAFARGFRKESANQAQHLEEKIKESLRKSGFDVR